MNKKPIIITRIKNYVWKDGQIYLLRTKPRKNDSSQLEDPKQDMIKIEKNSVARSTFPDDELEFVTLDELSTKPFASMHHNMTQPIWHRP